MTAITLEQVMNQWAMSNQSIIKIELDPRDKSKRTVRLVEDWPSVDDAGNYYNSRELDKRVDWTLRTLETWETAHRTAWDIWAFDSKRDAEKFITLYTLTWA
jgi:hypothetical protein